MYITDSYHKGSQIAQIFFKLENDQMKWKK